jgi:uncharacterized membrane protein YqjE
MPIAASLARLSANLIALLHTRAELATVEVEEEALRYFSYLMLTLAATFFLALAVLLAVLLMVALFWDAHRVAALLGLIVLFGGGGIYLGMTVRQRYRHKPHLLGHTLAELNRDIEALRPST